MTLYRHCDGPGCEINEKLVSTLPDRWLHVEFREDGAVSHFCDGDCLLKWAATWSEPPTEVPLSGGGA